MPDIPDPLVIGRRPMVRPALTGLPDVVARRPDSELDGANLPGLVVRGASIRGELHQHLGQTRQDAMGFWQLDETRLLACVADGLGSKALSHIGAAEACASAHCNVEDLFEPITWDLRPEAYFENIADDLAKRAESGLDGQPVPAVELSTTLVVALVDTAQRQATLMRVGDSEALRLREGEWEACFPQKVEESVSSSRTHSLPRDTGRVETEVVDLRVGDMLLLCTDGLARPMASDEVQAQLAAWWGQPAAPSLPTFFWQMRFRAKSHDDDRTAICVWMV
ncbi:protein phosphatase 2C domain-containing protein [Sphaerisporangium perillae]|uniref:protein phosphatase 2C domain-containing protein n=1 Tax=Sphaerisporangium perillae TaxID=2935860 RepID=UPI002010474C|nr:protein phosphatase 2C domain-containing protein [Sphaerisporangium perillae]